MLEENKLMSLLMTYGEGMDIRLSNRYLYYSPVLKKWIVRRWQGRSSKNILYQGDSFIEALEILTNG